MADHEPVTDRQLQAFVEQVLDRAGVPAARRAEASADYLEHLQADVDRLVGEGLSRTQAVAEAIAAFGHPHDVRTALEAGVLINSIVRELGQAVRTLWRRPLVTVAAIATLAIGIGANAAIVSVVDWVLLRPLPYPAPEELVRVFTAGTQPVTPPADVSHSEFASLSRVSAVRAAVGFATATRVIVAPGIDAAHVVVARVTGDLPATLGAQPSLGREFTREEIDGGVPVALLAETLWHQAFQRDRAVIGKIITIDGAPHTVIGVRPVPAYPPDAAVWHPITAEQREDDDRELRVVARLHPGASAAAAGTELATIARASSNGARTAWVEGLQQAESKNVQRGLAVLMGAAILILLLTGANVAALIAAQGHDRRAEIAVREALGASRPRLIAQLLSETIVLAVAGGIAGLLLGRWTLDAIIAIAPATVPRLSEIVLDTRVMGAGLLASLVIGVIVGLAPAVVTSRAADTHTGRITRRAPGRRALVIAQVAIAMVLTVGAGLLARSFANLTNTPNGFDADHLISTELSLRGAFEGDSRQLFRELTEAAAAIPGVSAASVAMRLPTQTLGLRAPLAIVGDGQEARPAILRPVGHRYFETVGMTVRAGRSFDANDLHHAPRVGMVNAAAVREVFSSRSPLGSRVTTSLVSDPIEIVGVVDDVTPAGEPDRPALYVPAEQLGIGGGYLLVRAAREPEALVPIVRERLRAVAPWLPLDRVRLVRHTLEDSRAATRFTSTLAASFALLALVLAAVGVYGLTASEVATRWRELAVRLALGSSHYQALWTILRPCAAALAVGVTMGIATALGLAPHLAPLLYQVEVRDEVTLMTAAGVLILTGLIAAMAAARKVIHANPASTLRQ